MLVAEEPLLRRLMYSLTSCAVQMLDSPNEQ
jgi:hypothetical protein